MLVEQPGMSGSGVVPVDAYCLQQGVIAVAPYMLCGRNIAWHGCGMSLWLSVYVSYARCTHLPTHLRR